MTAYAFPVIAARPRHPAGDGDHHPLLRVGVGDHRGHHAGVGDRPRETGVAIIGVMAIATDRRVIDRVPNGTDYLKPDRAAMAALSFGICIATLR